MSDSEAPLKPVPVTKGRPMIYTTGAFISPTMRIIDGEEVWMWVVEEFTDDSYMDGKVCVPKEFAYSSDDLLKVDVEGEMEKTEPHTTSSESTESESEYLVDLSDELEESE